MNNDDKALVERLRTNQCADNMGCNPLAPYCQCAFMDDAADRIEALSAENERLRDTPNRIWAEARDSEWDEGFNYAVKLFRAALGETK